MRLAVAFMMAALASASSGADARPAASPRAAYEQCVRLLERVFETRNQDQSLLRSLYTRDAVLVEASGNTIQGRNEIARGFGAILASGAVLRFKVTTETFRSDGRVMYAGGTEDIDERDGGAIRHIRHRFLQVMKREADGVWRLDYVLEAAA
jgi:uncharacterized protein (TIGR02246 family)